MKFLRNHCFQWQFYLKWHISYHKLEDEEFGLFDHCLCLGFWQIRWITSAIETDR